MQLAREQGDFLLVGLHTDDDVMERRGAHLPIMDLHERSLSVLACRYVNEVIIGELLPSDATMAAPAAFCISGVTIAEVLALDENLAAFSFSRSVTRMPQSSLLL